MNRTLKNCSFVALFAFHFFYCSTLVADEIPVAEVKRDQPVDFDKEVLPVLRQNCLACHNAADAEGDVVLESVKSILEGESVVPGKPDESVLLTVSAHKDDPVMPPEDNEVNAQNMTSEQLGLLSRWIAEGAKPSANSGSKKVEFTKLPAGINPVYALAMSPNGRYLASGRANQVFVYHVPSKRLVDRVTDPALLQSDLYNKPGVAHLDIVQAVAFSPDNQTFVTGGFRNIKIWRKELTTHQKQVSEVPENVICSTVSPDGSVVLVGGESGGVFQSKASGWQKLFSTGDKPVEQLAVQSDGKQILVVTEKKNLSLYDLASGKIIGTPLSLKSDVSSIAFAVKNEQMVVGLADKSLETYPVSFFTEAPEELKPLKKIGGHSQPPSQIKTFGESDSKALTIANDGTARTWDLNAGRQIRSFSHGGALNCVEITSDEKFLATCGNSGSLKIWNAANGQLIQEVKGDSDVDFQIASNDRDVKQKQQLIDAAKKDLDDGNKVKKDEEENVKKTEETLKKAAEEAKTKLDAKTKADKALADVKPAFDELQKKFSDLNSKKEPLEKGLEATKKQTEELKKLLTEKANELNNVAEQKKEFGKSIAVLRAKLQKEGDDKEVQSAIEKLDGSSGLVERLHELLTQELDRQTNSKTALDDEAKQQTSSLAELNIQISQASAEVKKQEPNIKKLTDAQTKAEDEYQTAKRNETLAKNSVDRAKKRAQAAAEKIPVLEKAHQAATETKEAAAKSAEEFKQQNQTRLTKLVGCAKISDSVLAYFDDQGNVGRCDFATGAKIDSYQVENFLPQFAFVSSKGLSLASSNLKQFETAQVQFGDKWTLRKTIGSIDDTETFSDRVTALDISSDGKLLATGTGEPSRSGEIKIWNLADGTLVKSLPEAHSDTILDIKFSPDGSMLASSSSDRFMKTFDVKTGELIRTFEGHTHHVMSVDWNSIGRELSTAGADKVVKVWDAQTGTQKRTISGYGKEVTSLCFVELSDTILTASGDSNVQTKRTSNGGNIRSFGGFSDFVYTVDSSADGKLLAAGGEDSVIRIWSDNGQVHAEFAPPQE